MEVNSVQVCFCFYEGGNGMGKTKCKILGVKVRKTKTRNTNSEMCNLLELLVYRSIELVFIQVGSESASE